MDKIAKLKALEEKLNAAKEAYAAAVEEYDAQAGAIVYDKYIGKWFTMPVVFDSMTKAYVYPTSMRKIAKDRYGLTCLYFRQGKDDWDYCYSFEVIINNMIPDHTLEEVPTMKASDEFQKFIDDIRAKFEIALTNTTK